jgi:hypothetical protein
LIGIFTLTSSSAKHHRENKKTGSEIATGPGEIACFLGPLAISLKWLQADRQMTTGCLHIPLS